MLKLLSVLLLFVTACTGLQPRYHRVRHGDTVQSVAEKYAVPVEELKDANDLASTIRPGQKLYIPFEERADWNKPKLVRTVAASDIPDAHVSNAVDDEIPLNRYIWPVSGRLSSRFGKRRSGMHEGIDIAAAKGTPVKAARAGHVIYASNQISGYGNLVIVRHTGTDATVYAHLSSFSVKKGQFVSKGALLGRVGMTGHATSPHLHFEIRRGQIPIDPLMYLHGPVLARNAQR